MTESTSRLSTALADRYKIERRLGAGGMATVYLAEDVKHERQVAVKVLRPELAAVLGADRFVQEIKTTASLQHPNILPLFDSGEADGFLYYVMPYIEGETLRAKLNRETQLGIEEAVKITTEVAEALDAAHQEGVIHRDIKPENILLHKGRAMVADFGIALAVSAAAGGRMTETGLSLGTPHYMSPEQATAEKDLTHRSDVYSLGTVLYEMLTGEPPHMGNSAQQIIMKIVTDTPRPVTELRKSVPPNVTAAVAKALEKLAADRFASAAAFAEALANPAFTTSTQAATAVGASGPRAAWSWSGRLPWVTATVVLALSLVVLGAMRRDRPATPVLRFSVPLGQGMDVSADTMRPYVRWSRVGQLAFSPDGTLLVYGAWDSLGGLRLYRQRLDQERADLIPGTDSAVAPVFSPDGAWIGFWDLSTEPWVLKRISVTDEAIETIAAAPQGRTWGVTWGDDGTIVVSAVTQLYQVAETGGEWTVLAEAEQPASGFLQYSQPHMLPGSKALLLHTQRSSDPETAEIVALDLTTGTQRTVLPNAMAPRYVPTGHLLFMRQGTLMAVGFDPKRLEVVGQPATMVEGVMHAANMWNSGEESGAAQVAVSASGHLAYARGGVAPQERVRVVRVTSAGDTVPLDMHRGSYGSLRYSPDGTRLVYARRSDIWVRDLNRGVDQPLRTGGFTNWPVEWSPDSRWLAFSSDRDQANSNIYRAPADGTAEPERLAPSDRFQHVASWSSDGVIAYLEGGDIWVLPPDSTPRPFFTSDAAEFAPTFSPDGRWLAYASDVSGEWEVYARPYPNSEPFIRISPNGGLNPAWSRDGRRLHYVQQRGTRDGVLMAVDVRPGQRTLQPGRPVLLIDPWFCCSLPVRRYDVLADGSFITAVADAHTVGPRDKTAAAFEVQIVFNLFEEIRARVGNE